jgi:hypothetical protein
VAIASTSAVTSSTIVNSKNNNQMITKKNNKVVVEISTESLPTATKETKNRNNKIVDEVVHDVEEEVNSTLQKLFTSLDGAYLFNIILMLLLIHLLTYLFRYKI